MRLVGATAVDVAGEQPASGDDREEGATSRVSTDFLLATGPRLHNASLLLVEDAITTRDALALNLTREGYMVLTAADGRTGLTLARHRRPDIIVLDLLLPDIDGLEVCRLLRQEMTTPILILTGRDSETDKVTGFDVGADDYMTKPYGLRELYARIKALLRRSGESAAPLSEQEFCFGEVRVAPRQRMVFHGKRELKLTPKEFDLLVLLLANTGHALPRGLLMERVWGYDFRGGMRTVDVHVRWLRKKVEPEPHRPRFIKTVRGMGYRFEDP